ncbi:U box domain [Trypanosoma melophagium]|uniref:U box domain n=1 Tax=Trypanosoma melophagium TaxID=715481 RepID=UPI00351A37E8|nr:U box domain [Trypanosoma melophagium]
MSVHSAIAAFLDQSPEAVAASTLSCLSSSLTEAGVAQTLIEKNQAMCREVLSRLVTIANDDSKNTNTRIMALESLYNLSHVSNSNFRCGDLFDAVHKLNESYEKFFEGQETGTVDRQHEMLTVLLFRCTGYTRLKAGDLLQQLYGGDDTRLVPTLLSIIKNRSFEWDIVHACMRCMYELTTPATYFTAPDENQPIETTKITAFQEKVTALLMHLSKQNALQELFAELNDRWAAAVRDTQLATVIDGKTPLTDMVRDGVATQFTAVFRYLAVMLLNVADFCERMDLVREYQQSFLVKYQSFMGNTLIPFLRLALICWEITRDPACESQNNPFMNVSIAVLRLLRFATYRPSQTLQETFASALASLTGQVQGMERELCAEYVGMLVLVLTVEVLCNVNAVKVTLLVEAFTNLVFTMATDNNPLRPGAHFTAAQAFMYCLSNETSTYCVTENESVAVLQKKLQEEDPEGVNEAALAIQALEEQLGMLQSLMMELALGQLLGDLCVLMPFAAGGAGGEGSFSTAAGGAGATAGRDGTAMSTASQEQKSKKQQQQKRKKSKHPPEYVCILTKKLMREPVVLQNGHRFELDALQEVVDRVGHVDPLTGEAFNDEIQVDMNLQQEIARYRVEMAARRDAEA